MPWNKRCRSQIQTFSQHPALGSHPILIRVRNAFRQLFKNPGFTAVAVLTLALGIGANTAVFSALNSILLRPLPYKNPEQLVWIFAQSKQMGYYRLPPNWANELFSGIMTQSHSFAQWARLKGKNFLLQTSDGSRHIRGMRVSAHLFEMLGIETFLGHSFIPEENELGRHRVVLLSHTFWRERLGGDPAIVGKTIELIDTEVSDRIGQPHDTLLAQTHTVIGVLQPGWQFPKGAIPDHASFFPASAEIWQPESFTPHEKLSQAVLDLIVARLKPGVTVHQAETETRNLLQRLRKGSEEVDDLELLPLPKQAAGFARSALPLLLGATILVLLIACANIANLLLARSTERSRESAIRAALGAGRGRLICQLLGGSLILGLLGGATGLLVAFWGIRTLRALNPAHLPQLNEITLDVPVLGFALCLSLVTTLLFGLAPALQAAKTDLNDTLKTVSQHSSSSHGKELLRGSFVVAQVGLSLVLLVGAGLLVHSFIRLRQVQTGYEPAEAWTVPLSFLHPKYTNNSVGLFVDDLLSRVTALPGVQSAAVASWIPVAGGRDRFAAGFHIQGRPAPDVANMSFVTEDYFKALAIPLLRGRHFAPTEVRTPASSPKIVSESFVRRYFPGEDPLGKRLAGVGGPGEIVGVVQDTLESGLDQRAAPHIYHTAFPDRQGVLVFRAHGNPGSLAAAVRREIIDLDRDQLRPAVRSMNQILADSIAERRFQMLLLSLSSAVALLLAVGGVYGVMTCSVAQRTREMGIRLALGAQSRDVLRLVVKRGMTLVFLGLIIGWAAALASTHILSHQLFGVTRFDPATFAGVSGLLLLAALVGCWLPARHATRVDPMAALRSE